MQKTFDAAELELFRNRAVRRKPAFLVDGNECACLPHRTLEEKVFHASTNLGRFWNTPLRNFWKSVYIKYRDELWKARKEKAGTQTDIPASDNHDGKPAA